MSLVWGRYLTKKLLLQHLDMVQHELLPHAVLPLAEGGHPSPHRGDMLTDAQVDALDEGSLDLPAASR
jgi:hypothetical protein